MKVMTDKEVAIALSKITACECCGRYVGCECEVEGQTSQAAIAKAEGEAP